MVRTSRGRIQIDVLLSSGRSGFPGCAERGCIALLSLILLMLAPILITYANCSTTHSRPILRTERTLKSNRFRKMVGFSRQTRTGPGNDRGVMSVALITLSVDSSSAVERW